MTNPHSKKRLLGHYIVGLPPDINGALAGPDYRPFHTLRTLRAINNLRAADPGAWSGRRHQLASDDEYRVFTVLQGNPRILDIREQYVLASLDVLRAVLNGEKISKNAVLTIDFVVTLPPLQRFGPLRYCGLSFKPEYIKGKPSEVRRSAKEESWLKEIGWMWAYVKRPTDIEFFNNQKLHGWTVRRGIDEVWEKARELAPLFYRTTSNKTLRGQLDMFAKRLRIPEEEQWFVFAAAYYFGFLQVNHKQPLEEDGRLFLKAHAHG